jgi:hypothetical protein
MRLKDHPNGRVLFRMGRARARRLGRTNGAARKLFYDGRFGDLVEE